MQTLGVVELVLPPNSGLNVQYILLQRLEAFPEVFLVLRHPIVDDVVDLRPDVSANEKQAFASHKEERVAREAQELQALAHAEKRAADHPLDSQGALLFCREIVVVVVHLWSLLLRRVRRLDSLSAPLPAQGRRLASGTMPRDLGLSLGRLRQLCQTLGGRLLPELHLPARSLRRLPPHVCHRGQRAGNAGPAQIRSRELRVA
mmetsp:Transcript_88613/g.280415  ORF Transcript_88613/g.280415 Transcript_88613/m.280415 type:complete len:203 (+) Transcript_88613:557-1165(+)